jgi:hypothetical protein
MENNVVIAVHNMKAEGNTIINSTGSMVIVNQITRFVD